MCIATTASTSRRSRRRSVHPADMADLQQAVKDVTLKQRAQNDEELPRTVSLGCSDRSEDGDLGDIGDLNLRSLEQTRRRQRLLLCPVTGRLSNVLDDYVVFPKVLGEGHYGCVRECVHRATRRSYACKSIDKSKIGRLDHLQREVSLLSEMSHSQKGKGIIKMLDCYEDCDYVHIVTEKYTGGELFDRIIDNTTDSGCYSEQKTAKIIKSLLESVAYLHENDIVHRDIKPENVLFENEADAEDSDSDSDSLQVKLIDFGLSRKHRRGEAPMSNPVGTAYYMAPELLKGRYDRSCDIWSIGTIIYILICGYPPFNGETDPEIFEAIKRGRFDFPERQWGNVSKEAKDLIKCLLRRDPRKRFTAKEALMHPWIRNCGRKQQKVQRSRKSLRLLRIP